MKIVIDHDGCQHSGAYADRCLGATLRFPLGHERYCLRQLQDDGSEALTVTLIYQGQEHTLELGDDESRLAAALEGADAFLSSGGPSASSTPQPGP